MKSAVIYARQSFGVEMDSASIEVQIENCRAWAKKNGVEVKGIYSDCNTSSELYPLCTEGVEASRIDAGFQAWKREQLTKGRKQFKEGLGQAFDTIRATRPDYLIVYTRNRLGRTAENSYLDRFFNSFLISHNTSLVDVQSNSVMDFSDKMAALLMQLKDALDYQGVAEKRRASLESIAKRINSYKVLSNAFAVIYENGVIRYDTEKAEAVKFVFDSVCSGKTYAAILKGLNTTYRHLANGKQWYMSNIYHILDNLVYCGYAKNKAGEIARAINIPQPLISFSQWSKAQELRKGKQNNSQKYNFRGQQKRHFLPFSGYIFCECGRRMQMVVDNGLVYKCNNPDHTMRIRVNEAHGYNFYKSIQALFMIHAIASRKKLEAYKDISAKVDSTKAKIARLENSLKAKMRMVESDEDFELLKPEIDACKADLQEAKKRLYVEEAEATANVADLQAKVETDFHNIMENEMLNEDDYQRLLAETIEKITVFNDKVEITLTDGRAFALPRLMVFRGGLKVIPNAQILCHSIDDSLDGIRHITIQYGQGEREDILLEDEDLTICLKY